MTITIAFPCRGVVHPEFAVALRTLKMPCAYECLYVEGADAAVARNMLAEGAVGDYIFFLDDDVLPPHDAIVRLLAHQKDFVSGVYYARQEPHYPQLFEQNKKDTRRYDAIFDVPENKLIEIDACGGGCMLIKKDVFKKITKPYFQYLPATESKPRKGEDYFFCEKLKTVGYKLYADTSVVCGHVGVKFVGPQHWVISKQRIEELKKTMTPAEFDKFKEKNYN